MTIPTDYNLNTTVRFEQIVPQPPPAGEVDHDLTKLALKLLQFSLGYIWLLVCSITVFLVACLRAFGGEGNLDQLTLIYFAASGALAILPQLKSLKIGDLEMVISERNAKRAEEAAEAAVAAQEEVHRILQDAQQDKTSG